MSRRTTIIILIVLAAIAVGVLVFFFLRRAPEESGVVGEFPSAEDAAFEEEAPTLLPPTGELGPLSFRPVLRQLSKVPIAGAIAGGKAGDTLVRYSERASGNIFEISAAGEGERRLTNTTIPKVYEALWNRSGNAVILRYLKDDAETIETFSAALRAGTGGTEGELRGSFLPAGIRDLAVSPDGADIFYLRAESGENRGIRAAFTGGNRRTIFASPISEWLPLWSAQETIALLSKPSAAAEGLLLFLGSGGGSEEVVLRGIRGLTALPSPALSQILYSESTDSGVNLFLYDRVSKESREVSVATLPEKCAWQKKGAAVLCGVPFGMPGGSYPDAWYQGLVSFSDEIWEIDAKTGLTTLVLEASADAGMGIDITRPFLSPDEKFLLFTNKSDGTLWSVQLTE